MQRILRYLPATIVFLFWLGLQLSGLVIQRLGYAVLAVTFLLARVWASPSIRALTKRIHVRSPITLDPDEDSHATLIAGSERYTLALWPYLLPSRLTVLDFNGLRHDDPYFEINAVVENLASFEVTISGVTGRLRVDSQDCNTAAQLMGEQTLPGATVQGPNVDQRHMRVRQIVTTRMAEKMLASFTPERPIHIDVPNIRWTGTIHLSTGDRPLPEQHPVFREQVQVVGPLPGNGQFSYRGIWRLTAN